MRYHANETEIKNKHEITRTQAAIRVELQEALRQGAATGTGCRRRGIVGRRGRLGHVRLRVARRSLGSVAIPKVAQAPRARLEDEARSV